MFQRFTSGTTPADLLTASMAVSHFPTCMFQQRQDARFDGGTSRIAVRRANHSVTPPAIPFFRISITGKLYKKFGARYYTKISEKSKLSHLPDRVQIVIVNWQQKYSYEMFC